MHPETLFLICTAWRASARALARCDLYVEGVVSQRGGKSTERALGEASGRMSALGARMARAVFLRLRRKRGAALPGVARAGVLKRRIAAGGVRLPRSTRCRPSGCACFGPSPAGRWHRGTTRGRRRAHRVAWAAASVPPRTHWKTVQNATINLVCHKPCLGFAQHGRNKVLVCVIRLCQAVRGSDPTDR